MTKRVHPIFSMPPKKKKKNPIFIRIEHIDVKDLRFTDQNFRERKYLKSFRERERERERVLYLYELCVSPLRFFMLERLRERETLFHKEWELLLPEMWGSCLPLFDWSLSHCQKRFFIGVEIAFSLGKGNWWCYCAVFGVELWCWFWVGATCVWAFERLEHKGQILSDIWFTLVVKT